MDVAELARAAVANGADLLGVAGGDGTQALVAGIAAEHDLPLLVISAGTRNHFALDLGLDRDDPSRCLDALGDGVELVVDLGFIAGRPFVNNASFGAYATIVQSPAYRDDKTRTTLDQLPGLLAGQSGPRLVARAENVTVRDPQAVLVSNNQYGMGDIAGLGRRARLDRGTLGVFAVTVQSAAQAAGLLRGSRSRGLTSLAGPEVVIDADTAQIPVGVDGEALQLDTPGALHDPAGRPAGPGAPPPSRGAGSQAHHGLETPAADGPDRAGHWPWMTVPDPRGRRLRRPSTAAPSASSTRSTRLYRAIAATPSPSLDVVTEPAVVGRRPLQAVVRCGRGARAHPRAGRGGPSRSGWRASGSPSATANLVGKGLLRRARPNRAGPERPGGAQKVRMPGSTSFPSGHSASAFAFATAVGDELPVAWLPLHAVAAAITYSRVHTGVHYPGDVLVGSLMGTGAAVAVRYTGRALTRPGPGSASPSQPGGSTMSGSPGTVLSTNTKGNADGSGGRQPMAASKGSHI